MADKLIPYVNIFNGKDVLCCNAEHASILPNRYISLPYLRQLLNEAEERISMIDTLKEMEQLKTSKGDPDA